ncbi:MAG TPA: A/G-specific adenine glycosylase [Planctomycetes bacterium]|nr:A/G-specific adenine glycosylase [Planctomycetota bacterium]
MTTMQSKLLTWFEQQRRDLPWRGERNPYAVWVSEIMLQQTQVETVIPFFERWMSRFPDVTALAQASESEVLQHWSGLGYYRRARYLHQAAKYFVDTHHAQLPRTQSEWLNAPGVGAYTSAAIASIAFGERVAVVDGNVKRVVARLQRLKFVMNDRALHVAAEQWSQQQIESASCAAGDWNEALMELGATVCRPRLPLCEVCPINESCQVHQEGDEPTAYPLPAKRKAFKKMEIDYVWATREGQCVLLPRNQGWNLGLYESPTREQWQGEVGELLGIVSHTITHHKISARFFAAADLDEHRQHYCDPSSVPLSGLMRKWLARCPVSDGIFELPTARRR